MQWGLSLRWCLIFSTLVFGFSSNEARAGKPINYNELDIESFDRLSARTVFGTVSFRYRDGTVVQKQITKTDVVDIAKTVFYEGATPNVENESVTTWAILQRQFCAPARLKSSISSFFRSFSQPIDPSWTCAYGGSRSLCRNFKGKNYCDKSASNYVDPATVDNACSKEKLDKRNAIHNMKWRHIHKDARQFALDFALGNIPNPAPGVENFVESRPEWMKNDKHQTDRKRAFIYKRHEGRTEEYGGGNAFYYERCVIEAPGSGKSEWSDTWDGTEVTIAPPPGYIPAEPIEAEKLVEEFDFMKPLQPLAPAKDHCETYGQAYYEKPFIPSKPWIVPFHSPND